jgi:hypothetical protein
VYAPLPVAMPQVQLLLCNKGGNRVVGWTAWPSFGIAPDKDDFRFIPNPKNPPISFDRAKATLASLVQEEILNSQNEIGVRYSDEQIDQIQARIWDSAQLSLIRRFRPVEQPKLESGK